MYTKSIYKHIFFNDVFSFSSCVCYDKTLNILRFSIRPHDLEDLLRSQVPPFQEIYASLGIKLKQGIFQFQKVLLPFPLSSVRQILP